jgi:uncharacterized protein
VTDAEAFLTLVEAQALYATDDSAHDFDHVLRVTRLAEHIAQQEGANLTVVRLAALCHDLPAPMRESRRGHHLAAAAAAHDLLTARGCPIAWVAQVVHCIEAHRFRDQTIQPQTLEAQCLYDADKLDSIGAIGVARVFAYAGRHANRLWTTPVGAITLDRPKPTGAAYTPVHEFVYKLQQLFATLHTATARRIGAERHAYLVAFFGQLDAEMQLFYDRGQ